MEYMVLAVALVGVALIFMMSEVFRYRKTEQQFKKKLYEEYGVLPERDYKPGALEVISRYFVKHKDGFYIDDITWNDLNMDEIFKKMNFTYSAAGEEYLYYTLRTPCMEEEELLHREEMIDFFSRHSKERAAYQFIYSKLGRTGKFSIYDYLDYLDQLGVRSNLPHYLALVLVLLGIGILFVNIPIGLLVLVCVLIYNNITYFKVKNEIDPYITSFAYIFRLLKAAEKLQEHRIAILDEEFDALKKSYHGMTGFQAGSFLIMSGGRMSGSGNPLDILLDFVRMGFHLDLIKFNQMLSEVRRHLSDIDRMVTILGKIETMICIGEYRACLGTYCIPEFTTELKIHAEGMYHPLIENPVANSISAGKSVLITGSNASGKSTFLKTVAIGSIFAQTIHTCPAGCYRGAMFRVVSSMTLKDDVQGGESYYMVEIRALKRIMDMVLSEGVPVLCFVDEVLRGTNTVERIAASTQILKNMAGGSCICFAATHDIELTYLLENIYNNYHFTEEIAYDDISFTYKIMEGRAHTRNAIKLLGIMGFSEEIIKEAGIMAGNFMETGVWQMLD